MPTLDTWGGRSKFSYSGSVAIGTEIIYGNSRKIIVSAQEYAALLKHFKGQTVPVGASRTVPPNNSLGQWLNGVKKTAVGSYVAAILVSTGHAKRVGVDIQII